MRNFYLILTGCGASGSGGGGGGGGGGRGGGGGGGGRRISFFESLPAAGGRESGAEWLESFSKRRSTDVVIDFLPVRWKLARLERHMVALPSDIPSSDGFNERDMKSTERGRPNGMAEWGNIFGLMGVMSMCSVQDVSSAGLSSRSTSTSSVRCSNGCANVCAGMLCSHDSRLRSESWNFLVELSSEPKRSCGGVAVFSLLLPDSARRWQNSTQDSYNKPATMTNKQK